MTIAEVAEHARSFPQLRLHRPGRREELLVAQKGDTLVHMELEEARLKRYQVSWTSGFTTQSCNLKADLCSGEPLVQLAIVGSAEQAGAAVLLDGRAVGELSSEGNRSLDVPLGSHVLTLEKVGWGTWSTELHYNSSSPGCDRLPVPRDALDPVGTSRQL